MWNYVTLAPFDGFFNLNCILNDVFTDNFSLHLFQHFLENCSTFLIKKLKFLYISLYTILFKFHLHDVKILTKWFMRTDRKINFAVCLPLNSTCYHCKCWHWKSRISHYVIWYVFVFGPHAGEIWIKSFGPKCTEFWVFWQKTRILKLFLTKRWRHVTRCVCGWNVFWW